MDCLSVQQLPGRGRGLVTTRGIAAGDIVLAEEPLLLTVSAEAKHAACAHCLAWLERAPGAVRCQACQQVAFCSPACEAAAAAKPWVHAPATCAAYAAMPGLLPGSSADTLTSLRFLIQAAALRAAATAMGSAQASGYATLMQLVGEPTPAAMAQAALLQPALCKAIGDASCTALPLAEVAALLAKEQLNSYGLLAPLRHQPDAHPASDGGSDEAGAVGSSRTLRGGGLWPHAALINHECLPNVARFDALDGHVEGLWPAQWPGRAGCGAHVISQPLPACGAAGAAAPGVSSTLLVMRALHELPPGSEVTAAYFPLTWGLQDRQAQAQQVYGFTCSCPRCLLEASPAWQESQDAGSSSEDGGWETDSGGEEAAGSEARDEAMQLADEGAGPGLGPAPGLASGSSRQQAAPPGGALDPGYLAVFLLKFVCPAPGCGGTLAGLAGSSSLECSVCGALRSEEAFLAELEAGDGA